MGNAVFRKIKQTEKRPFLSLFVFSLFFSLNLTAFLYRLKTPLNTDASLKLFKDRVMGNGGMVGNIDIAVRLRNYFLWFAIAAAITAFVFLLLSYLLGRLSQGKNVPLAKEWRWLSGLSMAGLALFADYLFSFHYSVLLLFLLCAAVLPAAFSFLKLAGFFPADFVAFRSFRAGSVFRFIGIPLLFLVGCLAVYKDPSIRSLGGKIAAKLENHAGFLEKLQGPSLPLMLTAAATVVVFAAFSYGIGKRKGRVGTDLGAERSLLKELAVTGLVLFAYALFSPDGRFLFYAVLLAAAALIAFILAKSVWFPRLNFELFRLALALILPVSLFAYPFAKRYSGAGSGKMFCLLLFCAVLLFLALSSGLKRMLFRETPYETFAAVLALSAVPFASTGVVQSVLLELRNILEKRGLPYVSRPLLLYAVLAAVSLAVGAAVLLYFGRKPEKAAAYSADAVLQKVYYPLLLLTTACVIAQPYAAVSPWSEYFESSNHGVALDALFRYGSIPIVQNFDAHMLSNELPGILYYLLNGYEPWAFVLYSGIYMIPFLLICYFFLKNLVTPRQALLFTLFLPFLFQIFDTRYIFAILLFFAAYRLLTGPRTRAYYYFWLLAGFLLLYQLDAGVSAAIGGLAALGFGCLIYKPGLSLKKFLLSGALTGAFYGLVYLALCLAVRVDPVARLREILALCGSNQNWAYAAQGDPNSVGYVLYYYVFPLAAIAFAAVLIVKLAGNRDDRDSSSRYAVIGFLFFTGFYLSNLPRGLVRHSLVEGTSALILSTFSIAVICYLFSKRNGRGYGKIVAVSLLLVVLSNVAFDDIWTRVFGQSGTLQTAALKYESLEPYAQTDIRNSRVTGNAVSGEAADLKTVLDRTLTPGETFFDFSSFSYYYALTGRKDPIYANQSPLMISGDSGQEATLRELKSADVPYVLMPKAGDARFNIDEIPICLKYYKLSEYIYSNYTPFVSLQNVDLWCLKTQSGSFREKLKQAGFGGETAVDLGRLDWSKLSAVNASLKKTPEGIQVTPNAQDPNLSGLMEAIRALPEFQSQPIQNLSFTVNSSAEQNIQIYYTLSDTEDFSEGNSAVYHEAAGNGETVRFYLGKDIDRLRFDMDSPLTITGIGINAGGGAFTETWTDGYNRKLGYLPLEWGESDPQDSYQNCKILNHVAEDRKVSAGGTLQLNFDGGGDAQRPAYLSLALDSAADGTATLNYGNTDGGGTFRGTGWVTFSTKAGLNRYMIRVSSYYDWWKGPVGALTFSNTAATSIREISVKQGD